MADDLYRSVVTEPQRWSDPLFGEWMEAAAVAVPALSRDEARAVRGIVRIAMKLAAFWSSPPAERYAAEDDWMARVDIAVGAPAWRPTLDLARAALEAEPSPDLYRQVAERFRLVTNQPFLGGAGFDEWLAGRGRAAGPGS
jgi:hypothetical protein